VQLGGQQCVARGDLEAIGRHVNFFASHACVYTFRRSRRRVLLAKV
jgi:hypothetical protein